jgi:hypothetical protein
VIRSICAFVAPEGLQSLPYRVLPAYAAGDDRSRLREPAFRDKLAGPRQIAIGYDDRHPPHERTALEHAQAVRKEGHARHGHEYLVDAAHARALARGDDHDIEFGRQRYETSRWIAPTP